MLESVNVGDIIQDPTGLTGVVTATPDDLAIRYGPAALGFPVYQGCLCDVQVGGGVAGNVRHGVQFLLAGATLVQAAGTNSQTITAPTVLKTSGGNVAYIQASVAGTVSFTLTDSSSLGGGTVILQGAAPPGKVLPLNLTTVTGITISAISGGLLTVSYT